MRLWTIGPGPASTLASRPQTLLFQIVKEPAAALPLAESRELKADSHLPPLSRFQWPFLVGIFGHFAESGAGTGGWDDEPLTLTSRESREPRANP